MKMDPLRAKSVREEVSRYNSFKAMVLYRNHASNVTARDLFGIRVVPVREKAQSRNNLWKESGFQLEPFLAPY